MTEPLDLAAIRAYWLGVYPGNGPTRVYKNDIAALCDEVERLRAENVDYALQIREADIEGHQLDAMRPVVEAAVALGAIANDRDWENTVWVAHMDFWEEAERDALEALGHAVAEWEKHKVVQPSPVEREQAGIQKSRCASSASTAAGDPVHGPGELRQFLAYEAQQVVSPSPVSASTGKEPSSDGEQSPAAGDRRGDGIRTGDAATDGLIHDVMVGATGHISALQSCGQRIADRDATIARLRTALHAAARALGDAGDCIDDGNPRSATVQRVYAARDAARKAAQEGA